MRKSFRTPWLRVLSLVVCTCGFTVMTGCITGPEFRAAAGPGIESGVSAIVNGVLDGLFAVIEPDASTN